MMGPGKCTCICMVILSCCPVFYIYAKHMLTSCASDHIGKVCVGVRGITYEYA